MDQIKSLTEDVLANLSIEELEERLEMQILEMVSAQFCYDCGTLCNARCTANCQECGVNSCQPNCAGRCDVRTPQ